MTLSLKEKMAELKAKAAAQNQSAAATQKQEQPAVSTAPALIQGNDFPASPLGELQSKLNELREAMLTQHPMIPRLLQTIHKVMAEQGDLVVQLSDEEIGVFISALKNHMNLTVVAEKTKKANSSATLKKASSADLLGGMDVLTALADSLGVKL